MREPQKTHWKKIVSDPNFLGEADFQEGEEKVLTIERVNASETVTTAEGKSQKVVIHWREKGNKPMIVNVARGKNIEKVAESRFVDDWPGVAVQLYIEHGIKAFGEVVSAVRVRPFKPRMQALVPPCADCQEPIQSAMGKSAQYMAAYTEKRYGAPLCADCAQKRKAALEAPRTSPTDTAQDGGEVPAADPETGEVL